MSGPIEPVEVVPKAFVGLAIPLNQCVQVANAVKAMQGTGGIKVHVAEGNIIIEYNPDAVGGSGITSTAGLPAGFTFEEFTICDSGTPATRWWATWLTDPS